MTTNIAAKKIQVKTTSFNVEKVRANFPILSHQVHGNSLVYLDNAATAQKPAQVIETIDRYYREYNSNIHRGVHTLSEEATAAYENSRNIVREFLGAASIKEIVFTSGTTDAINLVAQTFGRSSLKQDDEIIISTMEHHSNIVPWQLLCEQTGATLKVIPINENGELIMDEYRNLLSSNTALAAIGHISNAIGTINPLKLIIDLAHEYGAKVAVDGAQAVPHTTVNVQELDCDFYTFSGHKLFGPTGIGVLFGKQHLLEAMPPYQGGGDMIKTVTFEKTQYNELPYKFEAGTPNIAGAIGLGAAIEYVNSIGLENITSYERSLLEYGSEAVLAVDGLKLLGTAKDKTSILSFVVDGIHPHDIGTILDHEGIAIRAGHHCAMPIMDFFKVPATVRASLAFYNTRNEIDTLVRSLEKAKQIFK